MKFYVLPPYILQSLIWIPWRILFYLFAGLKISGTENLKHVDKGVIFASNHASELDPILIPSSLPFLSRFTPMFYVSREKAFYKKSGWRQAIYGGLFFKALGAYPVMSGRKNYEISLAHHIEVMNDKNSLVIFPEGKRSFNGVMRPARGGVTYLSYRTNSPIVPVRIKNSHVLLLNFITRKNEIEIIFGKPIYPNELFQEKPVINENRNDFVEAAQKVMDVVRKL